MEKITITIDLNKINKERIQTRTYTKDGVEVTVREYKMEVVPLKAKKIIKDSGSWVLYKTHFVCDSQTKEEREAHKNTSFLGEGIMFGDNKGNTEESINPQDVPF